MLGSAYAPHSRITIASAQPAHLSRLNAASSSQSYDINWVIKLRAALDTAGFASTRIVVADNSWFVPRGGEIVWPAM